MFQRFISIFFFFSYSFLAFVVVVFLKDRNITLGKIYFGSLGIVRTEKKEFFCEFAMGFSPNALLQMHLVFKCAVAFYGYNVDFYAIIGIIILSAFRVGNMTIISSSVDVHTGNDVIVKGLRQHELVLPWQLQ